MRTANLLFEKIFKKDPADSGNAAFLSEVCEKYPFFSLAHFFLLKQSDLDAAGFSSVAAKTGVFFNNPYWLNFQVNCKQLAGQPTVVTQNIEAVIDQEEDLQEETEELPAPLKVDLKLSDTTEDTISFDPLHTSDYFASQGIKLSEQVLTNDKLGVQLKSFTQWLKTMKKVHYETAPVDAQTDSSIQKLAEKSNTDDETLTEAMAEVLVQQGKKNKAAELYSKLSLLNPSKSAFFAAKIEQLKD